jgi:CubicO group peptidase (beta-lactamase class C family)
MPDIKPDLLRDAVAYLDRWLSFQQQLKEIPAVTVAVLHGDELLLSAGYGHANLEDETPATPAHIFRVASHSKWFTATAIMQLQEAGKLRLDDPLGRFIPWLREPLAGATVRQVLNHAAGIVRDGYENDFWQLEQPFPDAGVLRTLVEDGGDVLPPNWKLKYSNIGYSLLGLVVEAAAGVPYNQYMREQIIDRLGLTSTGPETNDEARARMVTGYSPRTLPGSRLPLPDVETGAMSPATGFYSTAEDLVRFAAAHFFGNDTLIGDNAKREMQRPYWWVENQGGYGLGMDVATIGERRVVGHSGGFPGHTTRTSLDPTDRLAISILTSESAGIAGTLMQAAVKLINLAQSQEPARDAAALDRYTGRFVSLWGFLDIVRLGNQLFAIGPNVDDPTVQPVKLEVMEEDVLKIEETDSFGSPGERVTYQRDAEGTVTKLIFAGSTQYPEGTMQDYLERRRRELAAG